MEKATPPGSVMWKALATRTDASADAGRDVDACRSQQRAAHQREGGQRPGRGEHRQAHPPVRSPGHGRHRGAQIGSGQHGLGAEHECDDDAGRDLPAAPARATGARVSVGADPRRGDGRVFECPRVLKDRSGHAARVDRVGVCRLWKACQAQPPATCGG